MSICNAKSCISKQPTSKPSGTNVTQEKEEEKNDDIFRVLIYGDSLTNGLDVSDASISGLTTLKWIIESHTETYFGESTEELLEREKQGLGLTMVLDEEKNRYDVVVLCAGTNDKGKLLFTETFENLKQLYKICENKGIPYIIGCSVPDYDALNFHLEVLELHGLSPGVPFGLFTGLEEIDLDEKDGIHLTKDGKQQCSSLLLAFILQEVVRVSWLLAHMD